MNNDSKRLQQIPPTQFDPPDYNKLQKDAKEKLKSFGDLLDTISSLEEKKKALWKHIYENAITDRNNAYLCFADLYKHVHNEPLNHGIHGQTIAKYLERMSKSTDQLLKLAELISTLESKSNNDEDVETGDIYDKIGKGKFK